MRRCGGGVVVVCAGDVAARRRVSRLPRPAAGDSPIRPPHKLAHRGRSRCSGSKNRQFPRVAVKCECVRVREECVRVCGGGGSGVACPAAAIAAPHHDAEAADHVPAAAAEVCSDTLLGLSSPAWIQSR